LPTYSLNVNGTVRTITADPRRSLLSILRDDLSLTGAKYGCGEGQCGSCTVLLNGEAVNTCVLPVSAVRDRAITTIEGLGQPDKLHAVQKAFLDKSAFQCGFCTPGMILGATALLDKKPDPSPADIKSGLERHICRCGTYPRIIEAVRLAAEVRRNAR
jgi:aerobic-type carbon monoxide dehydrogenase small subunit (CoxS/CutS family)